MEKASKYGAFAGEYMPELIHRGFDKIIWAKSIHNAVKLNWRIVIHIKNIFKQNKFFVLFYTIILVFVAVSVKKKFDSLYNLEILKF